MTACILSQVSAPIGQRRWGGTRNSNAEDRSETGSHRECVGHGGLLEGQKFTANEALAKIRGCD